MPPRRAAAAAPSAGAACRLSASCQRKDCNISETHWNFAAYVAAGIMWEYQDLDGQLHGPFTSDKMRQWTAKGYFQSDLQVCISRHIRASDSMLAYQFALVCCCWCFC